MYSSLSLEQTQAPVAVGDEQSAAWLAAAKGQLKRAPATLSPELALLRWAIAVGDMAELIASKGELKHEHEQGTL